MTGRVLVVGLSCEAMICGEAAWVGEAARVSASARVAGRWGQRRECLRGGRDMVWGASCGWLGECALSQSEGGKQNGIWRGGVERVGMAEYGTYRSG